MPAMNVTAQQAVNIAAAISAAARSSMVYVAAEDQDNGVLEYPEAFAGEIEAADRDAPKAGLLAYAADFRWRLEIGGIVVAGVSVATDDRAKVMITGARVAAMADPDWSTIWHGADGGSYPVNASAMVAISDAVQAHVNSGFATFASVKAQIGAGTITTTAEIDAAFAL